MEKISAEWFKHLSNKEAEDFKLYIRSCTPIRDRLTEILVKKLPVNKEVDYDCPSWSHKQADQNGYDRAIRDILKIVKIEP